MVDVAGVDRSEVTGAWVLDLDGVVWLGEVAIPGSVDAINDLLDAGVEVTFCTNNSSATIESFERALGAIGVDADGRVVSSATAVADLVRPMERVLVCGGPGVRESMALSGARIVPADTQPDRIDAVVVGYHRDFDYEVMARATRAVLAGARLIATNDDPIYPSADGPRPGCGAILAGIERATGQRAVVAGKPHDPMARVLRRRHDHAVFVGDSLGTDRKMADRLGWPFGLVLSGNVARAEVPADIEPEWVADDLRGLVDRQLAG